MTIPFYNEYAPTQYHPVCLWREAFNDFFQTVSNRLLVTIRVLLIAAEIMLSSVQGHFRIRYSSHHAAMNEHELFIVHVRKSGAHLIA